MTWFNAEKIVNGWTLTYWFNGEKRIEYLPSDEHIVKRIGEIFTAEKENTKLEEVTF